MPTKISTLKEKITEQWILHITECRKTKKGWEHLIFCIEKCPFYRGKRKKIVEKVLCAYDGEVKNA